MNNAQIEQRFQQKNIANCLTTIFPTEFKAEEHSAIAHEILHLMALLKDSFKIEFEEYKFITIEAKKRCLSISSEISDVLSKIKQTRTLRIRFVPAFICCELQKSSFEESQFEQYKALTLVVCIRLIMIGRHTSAVQGVCDEIRLFSEGRRENLAAWLPDIRIKNMPELIHELNDFRQKTADNSRTKQISTQLSKFYVSYNDSYQFKRGIIRNIPSKEFTKTSAIQISTSQQLDDEINATITELKETPIVKETWQQEENSSGQTRQITAVTIKSTGSNSYASQALQAKAISNRMLKKRLSLTCDPYLPTTFEIRTLILECIPALATDDKETVQLILLMLLFGINSEQVRQLKPAKQEGEIIGIVRKHVLPTQKHRTELGPILKQIDSTFTLPIPTLLYTGLKSFKFKDVNDEQIKLFIRKINKKHSSNITQTKISTCLSHKMSQESVDPIFTELIKGTQPNGLAALSYTQVKLSKLINVYKRYINFLNNISKQNNNLDTFQFTYHATEEDILIGSPLSIEHNILRQLFSVMESRLCASIKKQDVLNNIEYHNLVTIHVQTILALSSGYRPVNKWLGNISDINLMTGHYWISDKESRREDSSRVVIIPQLTIKILKQYLKFLDNRAIHYRNTDSELSRRYKEAGKGNEALFFYRDANNMNWIDSSPKTIIPLINDIFPLPLNWHRHHIRTLLHNTNIHPDLIAAWMGHADIGQGSLTQYSSINICELNTITNVISNHLMEIDIKEICYDK